MKIDHQNHFLMNSLQSGYRTRKADVEKKSSTHPKVIVLHSKR